MKLWKLAFGVSLVVNALLLLREIREKRTLTSYSKMIGDQIRTFDIEIKQIGNQSNLSDEQGKDDEAMANSREGLDALDKLNTRFNEFNQTLTAQHLNMIASNDQLEAFLEEHEKNNGR
ncbi:MAG: hypothetical protein ABI947_21735 [Chloroflexota bacterium]